MMHLCTLFKSAFITIIGLPNVGKSTFLNAVLGEDLVITNPKAQTTRHRIKGILNGEDHQLIFSDTPGIIEQAAYKLQDAMMDAVKESLDDADVVVLMLEANKPQPERFVEILKGIDAPVIVAVNKIDTMGSEEEMNKSLEEVKQVIETPYVFAISAHEKFNIDGVVKTIIDLAPEHPAFYDRDILTDENLRFIVSEMIREQILTQFSKEIPYSTEVVLTDYKEEGRIDKLYATIYVERDSQKSIILGKGGQSIKRLGMAARKRIEKFIQKQIFLSLTVKVRKDWRKDEQQLKNFGYLKK